MPLERVERVERVGREEGGSGGLRPVYWVQALSSLDSSYGKSCFRGLPKRIGGWSAERTVDHTARTPPFAGSRIGIGSTVGCTFYVDSRDSNNYLDIR